MEDAVEIIKVVLDRDCLEQKKGDCKEGIVMIGKPEACTGSINMCWLCHGNDVLAREIAEAVVEKTTVKGR